MIFPMYSEGSDALVYRLWWGNVEAVRSDPGRRKTEPLVSISELACGLAAVSPCLLLEDLRARLLKQFGTLTQASSVGVHGSFCRLEWLEFIMGTIL